MENATPAEPTTRRSSRTEEHRARLVKNYLPCRQCGEARHKNSDSGLCQPCYWIAHRGSSPFIGMTKADYDTARYDPRKRRDAYLRNKFGITLADYEAMLAKQDGRCAICRELPGPKKNDGARRFTNGVLVVDHCHSTGKVRGLLCDRCNRGLGQFGDCDQLLRSALQYLGDSAS